MTRSGRSDEAELDRPSVARMYDYYLGGSHNFAVDRQAADEALRAFPLIAAAARTNRSFLRRAVRFLVDVGVDQFLDLGSGIPTVGNVHEIAQSVNPRTRVVYVDVDVVAVTHSRAMLASNDRAAAVEGDIREPADVLSRPEVTSLLDLSRPVGILMVAVLPFVSEEDDPAAVVAGYRDAVPPGSHLVVSHPTVEKATGRSGDDIDRAREVYDRTPSTVTLRSSARVAELFDGFELVPPGLVEIGEWHRDPGVDPADEWNFGVAGVGRRR